MVIAIAIVLLVVGSVMFHIMSPWYLTPIASNWSTIDDTIALTFWVTGFVFVAVNLFMAYCVMRYRHRKGIKADYEPENKKLEGWLVGLTSVGIVGMLAPGLFVYARIVDVPKDAAVFEVMAKQWHWGFRFPGKDGVLGTVDARFVSDKNPFGINPDDRFGQDDVLITSPELHLPIGKPVKALLRSIDVLHDFAVPQFRVKMDLVPGLVTHTWFTPTRTGKFDLLCEQLCGVGHYVMRGKVVVEEEQAFQEWVNGYPTFAQSIAQVAGDAEAGKSLFAVCAACHGAQAEGNPAMNAPKLSGQGDWYLKRQLVSFKHGARGTHENDVYGKQMAPMAATLADDAAMNDVVAYIKTLPDNRAPVTLKDYGASSKNLYATCEACHGADGQGIQAMNAPRLAGMSDWYMVTQLKNFKHRIRGAGPDDRYGPQMATVAAVLADDQAAKDLVAYINTFK
ncbi:MAG: cytochrome-c oxidase [Betaproteobacteria bacterium]|nr:MAG: cytochrome-c oxidase [Betaproteobacteria bacterium]